MPDRTNNPEVPEVLPRPELNPLLNPLLGDNMGRWAQVYYTNPPEKREQAVLELLHELELESAHQQEQAQMTIGQSGEMHAEMQDSAPPSSIHCQSCGHENPSDQRFCGMCGLSLLGDGAPEVFSKRDAIASTEPVRDWSQVESGRERVQNSREEKGGEIEQGREENFSEYQLDHSPENSGESEEAPDVKTHTNLWLDRTEHPFSSFMQEEPEPRKPYRYYLSAVLILIIFSLGYVAWRNAQNNSAAGPLAPQAPPAASDQTTGATPEPATPSAPAPSASTRTAQSEATPTPKSSGTQHSVASAAGAQSSGNLGEKTPVKPDVRQTAPPVTAASDSKKIPQPVSADGSQELAVAEGYLNGVNGQQRNTAEAVPWLWKAVEKRNTEATILLSDLYLHGNGVPKNCDQAHVLLDAAASRGVHDAAVRLQNLRVYGCE